MSEKQEAEDFDEADDDEPRGRRARVDLARLTKDTGHSRAGAAPRNGVPAWRKLELLAEQRRTAELTSDFDDYDIDEPRRARRGASFGLKPPGGASGTRGPRAAANRSAPCGPAVRARSHA